MEGQSCEWRLKAEYVDSAGTAGEVILQDGDKPFFAESLPTDPEQHWYADVGRAQEGEPLVDCVEEPGFGFCP